MQDKKSIDNIINQMRSVEKNNLSNNEYINSIDLLLQSNNNGTSKDPKLSERFINLKNKMSEVTNMTTDFIETLNKNS